MAFKAYLSRGSRAVAFDFPEKLKGLIEPLLGLDPAPAEGTVLGRPVEIEADGPETFTMRWGVENSVAVGWSLGKTLNEAMLAGEREIVEGFPDHSILLHAATVTRDARAILIPAQSGSGKSTLAAWLIDHGYRGLSDDINIALRGATLQATYRPLTVRNDIWEQVSKLGWVTESYDIGDGRRLLKTPAKQPEDRGAFAAKIILLPKYSTDAKPRVELVSPARVATLLMGGNYRSPGEADRGLEIALELARKAPAIRVTHGALSQLDGALEPLLAEVFDGSPSRDRLQQLLDEANAKFAAKYPAIAAATPKPIPEATPRKGPVNLTIGMATYDDYDGVYFTVQALRMFHPEVLADTEFVIIDNHPDGPAAPLLKKLENDIPNYRYVPYTEKSGSATSKQRIFDEADGKYVLGMDCHVLLVPGAIARLLNYFRNNPDSQDLIQGPLIYDNLNNISSQWDPVWRGGMWGIWGNDPRANDLEGEAFPIPFQGLGCFAARRESWLGFNPSFRGFGGEEGYLHEKYRQAGRQVLCLPGLRWLHRFGRPGGTPYANRWEDRIHNYYVGLGELGLPTAEMEAHFSAHLGKDVFERIRRDLGRAPAAATSKEMA